MDGEVTIEKCAVDLSNEGRDEPWKNGDQMKRKRDGEGEMPRSGDGVRVMTKMYTPEGPASAAEQTPAWMKPAFGTAPQVGRESHRRNVLR